MYADYARHIASFLDLKSLKPLKIVCNTGNGIGGRMAEAIAKYLLFDIVKLNFEPDGNFPNGVPNPLLPENREAASFEPFFHVRNSGNAAGFEYEEDIEAFNDAMHMCGACALFTTMKDWPDDYLLSSYRSKDQLEIEFDTSRGSLLKHG